MTKEKRFLTSRCSVQNDLVYSVVVVKKKVKA